MQSPLGTPRAAIMAVFAAFGAIFGTFAGSVPQLFTHYGLSNASYGIGITVMSAATVAAMGLSGRIARHVSHRYLLLAVLPAAWVMLLALFSATWQPLFFLFAALLGALAGVLDVIMNAEGGAIEVDMKRPVYTAFHGSVSLSLAVFAILSSILSTEYGALASVLAASVAIAVATLMVYTSVEVRQLPSIPQEQAASRRGAAFTRPLVLIGVAVGLVFVAELAALLWSSKLLAEAAPELAALSGLGAAFFGLCNAIVRFPGDGLRARFGEFRTMRTMLCVAILGFAGLAATQTFAANVFFFAMTGMGLSLLAPCLFAMAARETPYNRAAGISVAMLVAGFPRMTSPTLFGAIAEIASTRFAFGLCAFVLVGSLIAINALARAKNQSSWPVSGPV